MRLLEKKAIVTGAGTGIGAGIAVEMAREGADVLVNYAHSRTTIPELVPYAASKGGIDGMTRAMALGLAPHNVRVNTVAPGLIEVDRLRRDPLYDREARAKQIPVGRVGVPEDIARVVVFFASDDSRFVTGQVLFADGGMTGKLSMRRTKD